MVYRVEVIVSPISWPMQVVQTRKCPLQCVVACIISLIMECSHDLGGLQPRDDYESSGEMLKHAATHISIRPLPILWTNTSDMQALI